jgi:hypothetical protein
MYYYGVGSGVTKEDAQTKALSNIAARISSTVSASMDISATDSTEKGYTEESKSQVKSTTEKIKFTGVSTLDNAYVDGKFYTSLRVDRAVLFNAQKKLLDVEYEKALTLWNQMQTRGVFDILKNAQEVEKAVDAIVSEPTIVILKEINAQFDSVQYRQKVLDLKNSVIGAKSKISFYLQSSGKLAPYYKDIVAKYISSSGVKIVENVNDVSNKKSLLTVEVSVEAEQKNVKTSDPRLKGATFADVTVILTTRDYLNKIVANNRVNVLNITKDGLEAAKKKTKKFEREIQRQGILNILLKTK